MKHFEKIANYEGAIMEKIAANAASKRFQDGTLSVGAYRKIRKYEEMMHSKGQKPIQTLHNRINSRQKANIPAKGTIKNYSARSTGYKEKIPEVLGTMRTSKFLGH